jgi:hypothetical protein
MLRALPRLPWVAIALLIFGVAGCGGDDGSGPGPAGAITLTLSGTSVTITQGSNGSVTATVGRQNGFNGVVVVTVEGLPAGVTAPALNIAAGQTTGTLTFTAAANAAVGTSALTVRATGADVTAVTASLSLVIQAAPVPSFSLSLSPATVSVQQGGQGTSTVTVTRGGGFTGAVALTATGAPTGMTVSFNPASATGTTSTATVQTTAAVAVGNHTITVRGNATGLSEQTATLTVAVSAAPGSFTLALNPTSLTVPQGASGNTTVTITRSGSFTGAVNLTATGLPNGVTASFNPAAVTGTTSTLTLTASASATTGAANLTVTGAGTGVSNQTATLGLTVQTGGGGGGGGNVSAAFCPGVGTPIWVAFQDGPSGSWVVSTPVNGVYSGQISSGRGGIAYVTGSASSGYTTTVRYATLAELQAFSEVFCLGATGTGKTVNVNLVGAGQTDYSILALGSAISVAAFVPPQPFQNVPDGTLDLLGARAAFTGTTFALNKLFAQRGINPAAGSTVTVDFTGSNALDPVSATLTIGNLGVDQAAYNVLYRTANRTTLAYTFDTPATTTTRPFGGFPTFSGSFHMLQVTAAPNFQSLDRFRGAALVFSAVAAKTVTLGADMGAVTVTAAATSLTLRPQAVIPAAAPYHQGWTFTATQSTGAQFRSAVVQASAGYVGGSPANVTLVVPDLSGVSGYMITWGLVDGVSTDWTAVGQSINGFGPNGQFADGATLFAGARLGTLSPQQ